MSRTPDADKPVPQSGAAGAAQPSAEESSLAEHRIDQLSGDEPNGGTPITDPANCDASPVTAAGGAGVTGQAVWRSGDAARRAHPVAWRVTQVALLLLFLLGFGALVPVVPMGIVELADLDVLRGEPTGEATWQRGVSFWAGGALCFLVVLMAIWRLMVLISHDKIFTSAASPWVDTIIVMSSAGALLFGLFAAFVFSANWCGGVVVLTLAVGAFSLGVFMTAMRGVLREATLLRNDLEDVI